MSVVDHESFAQALVVYAREEVARNQSLRDHPTPGKLAAYHADELSEAEDLEIQRHLAICSECPALLIDLEELFESRQRDLGLSDTGVASAWEDLRSRLGGKGRTGGPRPQSKEPWWAWLSTALRPAVLATGLAVLCVGLTTALIYTQRAPALAVANVKTVEIYVDRTRGVAARQSQLIAIPPQYGGVQLNLDLGPLIGADEYKEFIARILNLQGEEVLSIHDLARVEDRNQLSLVLIRDRLEPGEYDIQLFGARRGRAQGKALEVFPVRIAHTEEL